MKDKILSKLKLTSNSKNVFKILSGTMMGQFISFFTLPVMTRIYGAEIMGIWAMITSTAIIINSFSDLGLCNAIMVEDEKEVMNTYNVISSVSLIISIISGVVMYVYYLIFPEKGEISAICMALLIALQVWSAKQVDICYAWLNRDKQYKTLMKNPVINNISMSVIAITLGLLGYKQYGYYIAYLSSTMFTIINMKSKLPKKMFTFKIDKYIYTIKRNSDFVKYQMPTSVLNRAKDSLPYILMKFVFGNEAVGYMSISSRLVNIPTNLIANSVGRVFFSDVAERKRLGLDIKDFAHKTISRMFKIAMIPFLVICAFGDVLAIAFLGKDWYMAGQMLRITSLTALFTFIMMSTQGLYIVLNKQKYAAYTGIAQIISGILSFLIVGNILKNPLMSLAVYTVVTAVIQTVYYCLLYKAMGKEITAYLKSYFIDIIILLLGTIILRSITMQFGLVSTIL